MHAVTSAAPAADSPEQKALDAQQQLNASTRKLAQALDEYRDAVHAQMRASLAVMEPMAREGYLKRVVRSNSSGWSGGPYNDSNVREAIVREVYLARLTSFQG